MSGKFADRTDEERARALEAGDFGLEALDLGAQLVGAAVGVLVEDRARLDELGALRKLERRERLAEVAVGGRHVAGM